MNSPLWNWLVNKRPGRLIEGIKVITCLWSMKKSKHSISCSILRDTSWLSTSSSSLITKISQPRCSGLDNRNYFPNISSTPIGFCEISQESWLSLIGTLLQCVWTITWIQFWLTYGFYLEIKVQRKLDNMRHQRQKQVEMLSRWGTAFLLIH